MMRPLLLLTAVLACAAPSSAAADGPSDADIPVPSALTRPQHALSAPRETWATLLGNLRDHGEFEEGDRIAGPRFALKDNVGPTQTPGSAVVPHDGRFAVVFGGIDEGPDGLFHPTHVDLGVEAWMVGDGGFVTLDQWLVRMSARNRILGYMHQQIRFTANGHVVGMKNLISADDETQVSRKIDAAVAALSTFAPSRSPQ